MQETSEDTGFNNGIHGGTPDDGGAQNDDGGAPNEVFAPNEQVGAPNDDGGANDDGGVPNDAGGGVPNDSGAPNDVLQIGEIVDVKLLTDKQRIQLIHSLTLSDKQRREIGDVSSLSAEQRKKLRRSLNNRNQYLVRKGIPKTKEQIQSVQESRKNRMPKGKQREQQRNKGL